MNQILQAKVAALAHEADAAGEITLAHNLLVVAGACATPFYGLELANLLHSFNLRIMAEMVVEREQLLSRINN